MNKMQIITTAARQTDCTIKQTNEVMDAIVDVITKEIEQGGKVHISGLGTIEVRVRAPRNARNPRTGETIVLPERKYIQFTPARNLKERVK